MRAAGRAAQLSIRHSALRELVEREDRRAECAIREGHYGPNFTSEDCTAQTVISGVDGVMVPMMGYVWNQGSLVMLDRLGSYARRHRSGPKHEALTSLRQYVGKRVAMTDYPTFRDKGYDCGSGPTESFCGCLTRRLKGRGMRWDQENAESIMALGSLYYSRLWDDYWPKQRAA